MVLSNECLYIEKEIKVYLKCNPKFTFIKKTIMNVENKNTTSSRK